MSFEVIPYLSKYFILTHPEHLASIAELFGLAPTDPQKCRVLELGCGSGGNLIGHAFTLPGSEFLGVDLSPNHIAIANRSVKDLGLANIRFIAADLMDFRCDEFGAFDYVIAHGLLSWVPDFVQERVFEILRDSLAPNGIGYLSYNVYPGSHLRKVAQDPMRFLSKSFSDPEEKVKNAVSYLKFLAEETTEGGVHRSVLEAGLKGINKKQLPDILHDDLTEVNDAFYFYEISERLQQNKLQFLAEAELHRQSSETLSPNGAAFIDSLEDITEREQHIDFLACRYFRKSLICHADVRFDRPPDPAMLDKFLMVSSVRPVSEHPDLASNEPEKFVGVLGTGFEIAHPLTKMSLFFLGQNWAKGIAFRDLLSTAKRLLEETGYKAENWEAEFETTRDILVQFCLNTDLIDLHLFQPNAGKTPIGGNPRINDLNRWQLNTGEDIVTMLFQNFRANNPLLRQMLHLADETRTKDQLLKALIEFVGSNEEFSNREEVLQKLPDWFQHNYSLMERIGMFV